MKRTSRGLFVTATGTDIGKTYVSALIVKALREAGYDAGYYKAAISGIEVTQDGTIASDASFVAETAGLTESHGQLVSFCYRSAVSPHLAAQLEGNPVNLDVVQRDYARACNRHDLVLVEGSGGIACPLRWDDESHIMLEDVVIALGIPTIIVADAGLGTLNAIATTVAYLEKKGMRTSGIILNGFKACDTLHEDNRIMAEVLTGLPVLGTIARGSTQLSCAPHDMAALFDRPA